MTRKQTPQKARKESVSEDSSSRVEEDNLAKAENVCVADVKSDNSMQSSKQIYDSSEPSSNKPDLSKTEKQVPDSTSAKKTTPPKSVKSPGTASTKKSRRRLAANFNVKP